MADLTRGKTFAADEQVTNAKLHSLVDDGAVANIDEGDFASGRAPLIAATSAPSATTGLWFDTTNNLLKKYRSGEWVIIGVVHVGAAAMSSPQAGDFFFDTDDDTLYIRNADNDAWLTIQQALSAASQAEMEAASETGKYVAPATMQFHPGVAKFWGIFDGTAGTPAISTKHNMDATVTDGGDGLYTVSITTDFSSANWAPFAMAKGGTTTADPLFVCIGDGTAMTAGIIQLEVQNHDAARVNSALVSVAGFGDQA